jgi:hypothetical protein
MNKRGHRLTLYQPAVYQIEIVGHLNNKKAMWFENLSLTNDYGDDGTPVTIITGEVADQAALYGLLNKVRNLGLPLLAVIRLEPSDKG